MADNGDKTEKATPKHRQEVRSDGRVCKSGDLSGAVVIMAMFFGIKMFGEHIASGMQELIVKSIQVFAREGEITKSELMPIVIEVVARFLYMILPLLIVSVIIGLAVNYAQVGIVKLKEPLKIKWDKINPVNGFKNMFSPKNLVTLLKSIIKFVVLAYVLYSQLKKIVPEFPGLMMGDLKNSILYITDNMLSICFKLGLTYIIIGAFDYLYQRWDYEKGIMMTKQEVKDEFKQMEGDPKVKGKIKQKQQEMSMLRMMAAVSEADVVITNPTHYAIALKYDDKKDEAPVVLAKGKDFVAMKIKEKAKEHNIKMVENKPLARALYATVEIGEEIPPEFYAAVAEILAEIYRLKRQ